MTSKDSHQRVKCEYINTVNSNRALAELTQYERAVGSANK